MLLTRANGRISRKVKMEERRHLNKAAQRAAAAAAGGGERRRVPALVSDNTAPCCLAVLPRSVSPGHLPCTCPSKPRASRRL